MSDRGLRRRVFIRAGLTAVLTGPWVLRHPRTAAASPEEDGIVKAAKKGKPADLNGMIWSLYYRNMQRLSDEFRGLTGIGVKTTQDISIAQLPQRAMGEAESRSTDCDFFHIDSNMIPSLASAGLLEPLDEYIKETGYQLDMVGNSASFMKYRGHTYGIPTDGNVHIQYIRKDYFESPDEQKAFADKHGRALTWPTTWEEHQQILEFFHRPDKGLTGSGSLRNRAHGATWWYMYFYSAGGFPVNDDLEPTLNTKAGEYAVDVYLNLKKVSHPEAAGWGTPQMDPQIIGGHMFSAQYWDGTSRLIESGPKSATKGKFLYGLVPGSMLSGKLVHRSITSPLAAVLVNKHSPRKRQAAYMAMYWGTLKNSIEIVSHPEWTFHDPWHSGHFTSSEVEQRYTKPALAAIKRNLVVTTPPIYLTGHLEFQDALAKALSEAYVGQLKAKEVLTQTEEEWRKLIKRIGKRKLREELASYKAAFPNFDLPA